jgi:hypothetical protein
MRRYRKFEPCHLGTVAPVEFSRELRNDVLAGDITISIRLWKHPRVSPGGRYRVGPGEIQVDAIELVPFAAVTAVDIRRAGEPDREALRRRAAHAGPIDEDTLVYRVEFTQSSLAADTTAPRPPAQRSLAPGSTEGDPQAHFRSEIPSGLASASRRREALRVSAVVDERMGRWP